MGGNCSKRSAKWRSPSKSRAARWGLLLYSEIKLSAVDPSLLRQIPPNILIMTTDDFLRGLKSKGFDDLALSIRNDRTHLRR